MTEEKIEEVSIRPELIAIYDEAVKFVENAWPDVRPDQKRISILSIMKMIIDLKTRETNTKPK